MNKSDISLQITSEFHDLKHDWIGIELHDFSKTTLPFADSGNVLMYRKRRFRDDPPLSIDSATILSQLAKKSIHYSMVWANTLEDAKQLAQEYCDPTVNPANDELFQSEKLRDFKFASCMRHTLELAALTNNALWLRPESWKGAGIALIANDGILMLVPGPEGAQRTSMLSVTDLLSEWELTHPNVVLHET